MGRGGARRVLVKLRNSEARDVEPHIRAWSRYDSLSCGSVTRGWKRGRALEVVGTAGSGEEAHRACASCRPTFVHDDLTCGHNARRPRARSGPSARAGGHAHAHTHQGAKETLKALGRGRHRFRDQASGEFGQLAKPRPS